MIFDQNFYFSPKFRFLVKFSIFDQNFDFSPKFGLFTKISVFDQTFDFWPKFRFLTKISIFDQNFDFWPKFNILIQFILPAKYFCYIIGHAGTRLDEIRRGSGARIRYGPSKNDNRMVAISGTHDQIDMAVYLIQNTVKRQLD